VFVVGIHDMSTWHLCPYPYTMQILLLFSFLYVSASATFFKKVEWFQTSEGNTDRLTKKAPLHFSSSSNPTTNVFEVRIDPSFKYQEILGFGGAITQSSASVFKKLPQSKQQEFLNAYYGQTDEGSLKYNIGRLPIHSCDFSEDVYTFDDTVGDVNLDHFDTNVEYDKNLSIPLVLDALKLNPDMLLYATPWSPPAWMKTNNNMMHGGQLLSEYKATWALYFSKWITAYKEANIPIWGVTVQNEPTAIQTWESCIYTAEETRDFVADYLGPLLRKEHPSVKIFGWDHNKNLIQRWADTLLSSTSSSAPYIDGIAFHWYSGSCFDNVKSVRESYPDTLLLPSEACFELTNTNVNDDNADESDWLTKGIWSKGEGYGYDILGDLESGSNGWTDWNILLDQTGGPNHVGNYCDAPIIADVSSTNSDDFELYYHPQYWYLGHFSKFLPKGSYRLKSLTSGISLNPTSDWSEDQCEASYGGCDGDHLHTTAFRNQDDQKIVVIVMNCGSDDKYMSLTIGEGDGDENGGGVLENNVPAHSIQTYII